MSGRAKRPARLLGAMAGIAVVATAVVANRPEALPPRLGAMVSLEAASGGAIELAVPGGGPVLAAASLRPGDPPLQGRVIVTNRSPVPFRVRLRPLLKGGPGAERDNRPWRALRLTGDRAGVTAAGTVAEQIARGREPLAPGTGIVIPGRGRLALPLRLWAPAHSAGREVLAGAELRLVLVPVRERP